MHNNTVLKRDDLHELRACTRIYGPNRVQG